MFFIKEIPLIIGLIVMKKVILFCISLFAMQQVILAGPILSKIREASYYDFDEKCSVFSAHEKLTHDSTDSECYSEDMFDFISLTSSEQDEVTDTMSTSSELSSEISIEDELYMSSVFEELVQAIKKENVTCVKKIVVHNPQVIHMQDDFGLTALHHAFNLEDGYELNASIIKLLIDHGADTTKEDIEGITPENLVESYKNKIKRDCTATDEDFQIISQVYQSMSPDSPQLRKRF